MAEPGFNSLTDVTLKLKTDHKKRNRSVYLTRVTPAEYHALCEILHLVAADPVGALQTLQATAP